MPPASVTGTVRNSFAQSGERPFSEGSDGWEGVGFGEDIDHRCHPVRQGEGFCQGRSVVRGIGDSYSPATGGLGDGGVIDAGEGDGVGVCVVAMKLGVFLVAEDFVVEHGDDDMGAKPSCRFEFGPEWANPRRQRGG